MRKNPVRRSLLLAPFAWAFSARAQTTVTPLLLAHAGRLLATLIQAGREAAIAAGVKPVPPRIHRALLGYFPDSVLRKVRYASGHAEAITIPGLVMTYGHFDAVTLGDVILFRDEDDAADDAKLWAHELTHVMQYERWGTDGFAKRYIEDRDAIEREARGNAERFLRWREQV